MLHQVSKLFTDITVMFEKQKKGFEPFFAPLNQPYRLSQKVFSPQSSGTGVNQETGGDYRDERLVSAETWRV